MRPQAEKVLNYLRKWGADGDRNISRVTKIPADSIRRSIQELIHERYNITYAGYSGLYTLAEKELTREA